MIRGKVVRLRLLKNSDEDLDFYLKTGQENLNVNNLTDHFLDKNIEDIREAFNSVYNSADSTDFVFCICWGEINIGILYILREIEKRTAEIQVLLAEEKYRKLGMGFDAIYAAIKFCKEELNLHCVTFKFAEHNTQMLRAFQFSQMRYDKRAGHDNQDYVDVEIDRGVPDILLRGEFQSKETVGDYWAYTFVLDEQDFPYEDFLKIASGKHGKYKNEEGKIKI